MIERLSLIVVCAFSLLVQVSTSQADVVVISLQGKCTCKDLTKPAEANTVQTDSRLRTRTSANTNHKSWLQFDLNAIYAANPGLKGNIVTAALTFTGTADNTSDKPFVVNGLNDSAGLEGWAASSLTWNNAPGNKTDDTVYLNTSLTTANLFAGTIPPGDGSTYIGGSPALRAFLNTDSDGLVTFILTPGWTALLYNAGSAHPPVLTLSAEYSNASYFVATDGNDLNIGDINHPFKTIGKAVSVAAANDTIYLRGGQHNYSDAISISKSGDVNHPITLQNYQNETVILDFSGEAYQSNKKGISLTGSYWHLNGFTVQYTDDTAIYVTGSHNILERLVAYRNGDTGLHLGVGAADNLVLNCDACFNYDHEEYGQDADGFGAKGPTGSLPGQGVGLGNIFRGCRSWNNADDGYDLWFAGNPVRIENCWAVRNGVNTWPDPCFVGNGQGFKLGQGTGAHTLINCMSYNNQHKGFDRNGNTSGGITIYNCTSVKNLDKNFYFNDPCTTHSYVFRNNISHLGTVTITGNFDAQYNSWNSGFTVSDSNFASLDPNGIDGPRGPNGELPKLKFLRLAAKSKLIDAGINVGLPYYGNAPDLGAFEHIDGDCQPDGDVDLLDLKCLADNWLNSGCGTCNGADFDGNNKVNFYDFAIMARNWLKNL